jgi:hypothetical protein
MQKVIQVKLSAQMVVLSNPYLLEMIILQLDIRTLLMSAQLVCHTWGSTITSSSSIQQALFFRALPRGSSNAVEKTYNPLLAELFPSFFPQDPSPSAPKNWGDEDIRETSSSIDGKVTLNFALSSLDMVRHPEKMDAYLRKDASWRRMLVQQPPALSVSYLKFTDGQGGGSWKHYKIPCDIDGMRMSMLYDLLLLLGPWSSKVASSLVLWWGYTPVMIRRSRSRQRKQVFERALQESDIVIYTKEVIQCVMGRPETPEHALRHRLGFPYGDWGSDKSDVGPGLFCITPIESGSGPYWAY